MKPIDIDTDDKFRDEARSRWGGTPAYAEYSERTKNASKEQQAAAAAGLDAIMGRFALCMESGASASSDEARSLVRELQAFITEHYYTCTDEILSGLGEMYSADERFRKNIDRHAPGTAGFISRAIAERR